ncbi:hypothetical protein D3C80_1653220 [compost metagenome]
MAINIGAAESISELPKKIIREYGFVKPGDDGLGVLGATDYSGWIYPCIFNVWRSG